MATKYFGHCKCCLDDGHFKSLWEEHLIQNGETIVYGEMLTECFALEWQPPDGSIEQIEQICDRCIQKLEDSLGFKRMILRSQKQLDNNISEVYQEEKYQAAFIEDLAKEGIVIKEENDSQDEDVFEEIEFLEEESPLYMTERNSDRIEDRGSKKNRKSRNGRSKMYTLDDMVQAVTSVLESTESIVEASQHYNIPLSTLKARVKEAKDDKCMEIIENVETDSETEDVATQSGKRLRSFKRSNLLKAVRAVQNGQMKVTEAAKEFDVSVAILKQRCKLKTKSTTPKPYTISQLLEVIKSIKNNEMDINDASAKLGISVDALVRKIKWTRLLKSFKSGSEDFDVSKHEKLLKELADLLASTNVIPFKAKGNKLYCSYCRREKYTNMDDLRSHVTNIHASHRISNARAVLTPVNQSEVCKVDITDLTCTICYKSLTGWPEMFEHLKEHDLEFEEAYTRIIPYKVTEDLSCALCDSVFPSVNFLVIHMNSHYNNYICQECGDTFLTSVRLAQHSMMHYDGKLPCEECGKLFSKKYREKHIKLVHNKAIKFRCSQCYVVCNTEYGRHLHMKEAHGVKFKVLTCEFCDRQFDWRPYYMKHKRIKHPEVPVLE